MCTVVVVAMVKLQQFVISEPDKIYHQSKAIQRLSAPIATSKFVLTAHYNISIRTLLAKNQQPYFVKIF